MSKIIFTYSEAFETGISKAGGKGWNLSRLERYGFKVPEGCVLSSEVYHQFINYPEIMETIKDGNFDEKHLEKVREKIISSNFSDDVLLEIDNFILKHNLIDKSLAVRSSATGEDGDESSFAGIHSSFLNVSGFNSIIEAIKKCFASLWTIQAVTYRKNKNYSDNDVSCAVVICEMVKNESGEPHSAGVLFTAEPLTGNRNEMRISAVNGLAEKLVSGRVNPEEITLKVRREKVSILRDTIDQIILSDTQIMNLYWIGDRIAWALGDGQKPQDIEWAFDGNEFWIVQARPVTNLPYPTADEIKDIPIIWSNANFKDAIPGVQTTLSWSNLQRTIRHILFLLIENVASSAYIEGMEVLRRFKGRMYFDLTYTQWVFYEVFGLTPYETNKVTGGHQPEIPYKKISFFSRKAMERNSNSQKLLKVINKTMATIQEDIDNNRVIAKKYKSIDYSKCTKQELLKHFNDLALILFNFAEKFILTPNFPGIWISFLELIMNKLLPADETNEIISGLLAGTNNITSAEQGYRIYEIARSVLEDSEIKDYFTSENFDPLKWKNLDKNSDFMKKMEKFLEDFGHRAVYEGEFANPRWNEDQSYILDRIRELIIDGDIQNPQERAIETRKKAEEKLRKKIFFFRPLIKYLIKKARIGSYFREEAKSSMIVLLEPFRMICFNIAERMVNEGNLNNINDLFQLSIADLTAYINDNWDGKGALNLVADRKKLDEIWGKDTPPDVIITDKDGNPADFNFKMVEFPQVKKEDFKKGLVIKGIPASSGIVTGKVKVILHPSEGDKLEKK